MKLVSFDIGEVRWVDETAPLFEGAATSPAIMWVDVVIIFAPPDSPSIGHDMRLTLRFPRNNDVNYTTLKKMVCKEIGKFLPEVAREIELLVPGDGSNVAFD